MPRHDRAYGHHHSKRSGGGSSRRHRAHRGTYAAKQGRSVASDAALAVLPARDDVPAEAGATAPAEMGRKDGSTQKSGPAPQKPKPQKGPKTPTKPVQMEAE